MFKKIMIISIILFLFNCAQVNNPIYTCEDFRHNAHGFWKANSGDTDITNEIGLISYNWYAIDTASDEDSVYVTWDDGIACTKSSAMMDHDKIILNTKGIQAEFIIKNNLEAEATFSSGSNIYHKNLLKLRDDHSVLCD